MRSPIGTTTLRAVLILLIVAVLVPLALQGLSWLAVQQGDRAQSAGDLAAAQAAFRTAAERTPWDVVPRDRLAQALLAAQDYTAAAEAYRAAAALGGWTATRHTGLGQALAGLGDSDGALAEYEAARALDPNDAAAPALSAPLYWDRHRWPEAETAYSALLAAAPDLPGADVALAHYRYALLVFSSAPDSAREHLEQARADPRFAARVPVLLAALDEGAGLSDPAYRAARLGVGLAAAGEYLLAGGLFRQAVDLNPQYGQAYAYLGFCYDRLGEDGTIYINRGTVLAPDDPLVHMLAGYHYRDRKQWMSAREEFERALALDPANAAAVAEIGQTYAHEGRYDLAEPNLQRATAMAPGVPEFWLLLAGFYLDVYPNLDQGVAAAERAAALAPDDPAAVDMLGWARFKAERLDEAQQLLERADALDPARAMTAYHLGMLYLARSQLNSAREALSRAQALDPGGSYGAMAASALEGMKP